MNTFLKLVPKTPKEFFVQVEQAIVEAEKELKLVSSLPKGQQRAQENTLEPFNRATIAVTSVRMKMALFEAVHPDKKIRAAAEKSLQKLIAFFSKTYLRPDLYEAIKRVSLTGLDKEAVRYREKELMDFKLTGVDKPEKVRNEIKRLMDRELKLGQAFDRNIKDDVRYIELRETDLDGLPEDYKATRRANGKGVVKLSTQYPDYLPFMEYATNGKIRKSFSTIYLNRGWPKNDKVFKELLSARSRHATLLGFKNWADYITVDKMVKNSKNVKTFLEKVSRLTIAASQKDYKAMLARKQKDDPKATEIGSWESLYYDNMMTKDTGFDSKELRDYFQYPLVKEGVLKTTGHLFGLVYKKVKVPTWHKDVEVFDVSRKGKVIGRFYLDMHAREGKYGHAACFEIRPGVRDQNFPEAALVCNFSRGLMTHNEVVTFFHEFGHLLHFILAGDQKWCRFSGVATEWDFVEAPSQMLEAWAKDFQTLKTFAKHHKTGKVIPEELLKKMRKVGSLNRGLWQRRQLSLTSLSLEYHLKVTGSVNLSSVMNAQLKKYSPIKYPEHTHMYAGFGHLNGYSAMYYTYMWSRAIAQDLLSLFEKNGMHDRNTAKRYMENILMPGGSKNAQDLIKNFLGRDWSLKAFQAWLEE
jgi:thimet oligopeptidase